MMMKKTFLILSMQLAQAYGFPTAEEKLHEQYIIHCQQPSDIHEHLPVLEQLAQECSSIVELGVRDMVSTWGILKGLSANPHHPLSYLGIDLMHPPLEKLRLAEEIAEAHHISFQFWKANVMDIDIEPVDLLFIDTLHTYCQLTFELEKFSPKVRKYIAMHDTSAPWGEMDDSDYQGNYSEYPSHINRDKRGLWPAVVDFLKQHPEWTLLERRLNNHGFTILKRNAVEVSQENLPEPYNTVKLLPFDNHGWFVNGPQLEALIKNHPIKVVIEIGSWLGASTRFIAWNLPKDGKVYAVDHWLGSEEHQPGQPAHLPVLPVLYEQFLSNVIHEKLTGKIIPIRMKSLDAAQYLQPIAADLVYIDASHDTASVLADLNAWYPFVRGHGYICGDDWIWPPIQLAVEQFAKEQGLTIEASGNFWCLLDDHASKDWERYKQETLPALSFIEGGCPPEKAKKMMDLIYEAQPKVCVNIGVYAGASIYPTAQALKYQGDGKVFAIDPWTSEDNILLQFKLMLHGFELYDNCEILHMTPANASHFFENGSIDILHIEKEDALDDLKIFLPKIKSGGYIWLNDKQGASEAMRYLHEHCTFDPSHSITNCYLYEKN